MGRGAAAMGEAVPSWALLDNAPGTAACWGNAENKGPGTAELRGRELPEQHGLGWPAAAAALSYRQQEGVHVLCLFCLL